MGLYAVGTYISTEASSMGKQYSTSSKAPTAIDEYIASQSDEIRPILHKVRDTIRTAAPEAIEKIAWRMPTFWQGENIIHFAAFKKHIGIFPGDLSPVKSQDQRREQVKVCYSPFIME